jgi:hypothetical protein
LALEQIAEAQFRAFEEFDEHSEGSVLRLDTAQGLDGQVADIARALDARGLRCRASRGRGAAPRNP